MRSSRDDFQAGIAAIIILNLVLAVLFAHGQQSNDSVSWWDIALMLVFMAIFAGAVIDVYKYRKGIK
jgi:hypothetical protein